MEKVGNGRDEIRLAKNGLTKGVEEVELEGILYLFIPQRGENCD